MIVQLTLRGHPILVWQAENAEQASRGLTGQVIDDDEGLMLPGAQGVHTMGVPHALDLVWFDLKGNLVAVDQNVSPGMVVVSKGPVVLELRGGWFSRHPPRADVAGADVSMSMQDISDATLRQLIAAHHRLPMLAGQCEGGCPCKDKKPQAPAGGCGSCAGCQNSGGAAPQPQVVGRGMHGGHGHHGHHGHGGGGWWGGWGWPWPACSVCVTRIALTSTPPSRACRSRRTACSARFWCAPGLFLSARSERRRSGVQVDWNEWLQSVEPTLRSGLEVIVPRSLPHPREVGFERPFIAEPWGQKADWVMSLRDGSRLHVHEFDSALVLHLDKHDPAQGGPGRALYHWGTESASGRATLFTIALWILLRLRP